MPKKDFNGNPIQSTYDDKFNGIKKAEEKGNANSGLPGGDGKSGIDGLRDAEETPGWENNVEGMTTGGLMAALKKKSPTLAILITLVAGGMTMMGLSTSTFLPEAILSNVVQKFNIQETSLTIRTNKLISSKMVNNSTSGSCQYVKVLCRFSTPSNRFLKQLEKNGIKALDKNKKPIVAKGLFNTKRPRYYSYTNSEGKKINVEAKQLYSTLVKDAEFRTGFHNASMTRFASLADEIFMRIKMKFGFTVADKLNSRVKSDADGKTTKKGAQAALEEVVDDSVPDNKAIKSALKAGGQEAADALTDAITEEATAEISMLDKASSAITKTASAVCTLSNGPSLVARTVRGYQMAQYIKYAAVFLAIFGAIKAGDAQAEEVSAVGDALTQPGSNGKSAMDSFSMHNVMSGDTTPQNDNYLKFVPGAAVVAALAGIMVITNSKAKKTFCNTMGNPLTGATIDATLALNAGETMGATALAALADIVGGWILGKLMDKYLPPFIEAAVKIIPVGQILNGVLGYMVGDSTKNLKGEGVGDAIVSGASHVMGQTGNQGGNMPLTVPQAIAYAEKTKEVQLAYAEEDRATLSPLDPSSPNTMMGMIIQKLIPYTTSSFAYSSVPNFFATVAKMTAGSIGTVLQPLNAQAADPAKEYTQCADPDIKDSGIASGPYCNIIYGIPTQYLDKEPTQVVQELIDSHDIDPDTGEPIDNNDLDVIAGTRTSLKNWLEMCTDGKTDQAENCKVNDKTVNFALYTIDHRIQKTMDEDLPDPAGAGSSAGGTADPGDSSQPANTEKKGKGWSLKKDTDYSGTPCATGTTDKGTYKHPKNGFTIRKCSTPLGMVASLISQRTINMVNAAKTDGVELSGSGFRSYEEQKSIWDSHGCPCPGKIATPGNSNHERGLAVDFDNAETGGKVHTWLAKNGAKYGYINYPVEYWHWSMSGG